MFSHYFCIHYSRVSQLIIGNKTDTKITIPPYKGPAES